MKLIFTIIVAFTGAVALARMAMEDPGFVVFAWDEYTVKLPFLLFTLMMVVSFVALYLLINTLVGMFRAPRKISKWNTKRNEFSSQESTMKGYAALIEGNWGKAEKALLHKIESDRSPMMGYLGAAYAAQQQGKMNERDRCLDEALKKYPGMGLAINLTPARLLFQNGDMPQSREWLERLKDSAPRNIPVIRLLSEVYQRLGDWHALVKLLPKSSKLGAFTDDEFSDLEKAAYKGLLGSPALLQGGLARSEKVWHSLPIETKKSPDAIAAYSRQLIAVDEMVAAERVIRQSMNKSFNSELAYLYGKVDCDLTSDQIKLALSWAKENEENPSLKLTLARLYQRNGEVSNARGFLRQILDDDELGKEASLELAVLLERNGEREAAMLCYKM
ncbi:MAG: hypothetical protein GKR96_02670 [Gammaproteobacteria bacterium]|nr:hypothetical protein [Gammaproteobacteria bacterium]